MSGGVLLLLEAELLEALGHDLELACPWLLPISQDIRLVDGVASGECLDLELREAVFFNRGCVRVLNMEGVVAAGEIHLRSDEWPHIGGEWAEFLDALPTGGDGFQGGCG